MTEKEILNTDVGERIDHDDFEHAVETSIDALGQFLETFVIGEDDASDSQLNTHAKTFIVSGFVTSGQTTSAVTVSRDTIHDDGAKMQPGLGVLARRDEGVIKYGVVLAGGDAQRTVSVASFASGTYGVFVRFAFRDTDVENRIFWKAVASPPLEDARAISTRSTENWDLAVELVAPGPEWTRIATANISGGLVSSLTDGRSLFFEGKASNAYAVTDDEWGSAQDRENNRSQHGVFGLYRAIRGLQRQVQDIIGESPTGWWKAIEKPLKLAFMRDGTRTMLASIQFAITDRLVPRLLFGHESTGTPYMTLLWEMPTSTAPSTTRIRVFVTTRSPETPSGGGMPSFMITTNAWWDDGGGQWTRDTSSTHASRLRLNPLGIKLEFFDATGAATWGETAWLYQLSGNGNIGEINATRKVRIGAQLLGSLSDALLARLTMDMRDDSNQRTLLLASDGFLADGPFKLRIYRAMASLDGVSGALEFVFNAYWNGTAWYRLYAGFDSVIISFDRGAVRFAHRAAAASDGWANDLTSGGWGTGQLQFHFQNWVLRTRIGANTAVGSDNTTPTLARFVMPIASGRCLIETVYDPVGFVYRRYIGHVGVSDHIEETTNCAWNGVSMWVCDTPTSGAAVLARRTETLDVRYKKVTSLNTPWADNAWDQANGASAFVETAAGAPPTIVTWAGHNIGTPYMFDDGGGWRIVIPFTVPMPNTAYVAVITDETPDETVKLAAVVKSTLAVEIKAYGTLAGVRSFTALGVKVNVLVRASF